MKRLMCIFLSILSLFMCTLPIYAADVSKINEYKSTFKMYEGPEINGLSVDYVAFSPKTKQGKKYPIVIYFHGMGQGSKPGSQISDNNFPLWASNELQSKFNNGGAYLLAFRSKEEKKEYWEDKYIESVKAAIDEFINKHKNSVDLKRIYVGGFSMGGMMTLKMLTSYPTLFAAAFPMCPAYLPTEEQYKAISNIPLWITTSKYDVIAGYHSTGKPLWENICKYSNRPKDCRFTLMGKVCYPDGKKCPSNHHVWFAISNDMFAYDGSAYPNATTTDGTGKEIKLEYPSGIISWMNKFTSKYNGTNCVNTKLVEKNDSTILDLAWGVLKSLVLAFGDTVKAVIKIK